MRRIAIVLFVLAAWCFRGPLAAQENWYEAQQLTPETMKAYHLSWGSCCNHGDVCKSCVVHRTSNLPPWGDSWWYEKDGITNPLPPHIVEYVPWTPTGKPVIFLAPFSSGNVKVGEPVCLKVPGGGV